MNKEIPQDVTEGRSLLEKYEKSNDHIERTRYFRDGIDILDDFISDEPDSPHKTLINNLKLTCTRNLLKELPGLPLEDTIILWMDYIGLLMSVKNERMIVCQENHQLERNYIEFRDSFKEVFFEMVK